MADIEEMRLSLRRDRKISLSASALGGMDYLQYGWLVPNIFQLASILITLDWYVKEEVQYYYSLS